MPLLKMSRRTPLFLFIMAGTVLISSVSAGWERIGFAGKEIRALAVGRDAVRNHQVIYTPVDDSGVFMVYGPDDSTYQFPSQYSQSDWPAGKIRSLLVTENGATALAGSDSGLYFSSVYSSTLPMWVKTSLPGTQPVIGMANGDSAYCCAVTASGIFRSKGAFGAWSPCSLAGAPVSPVSGSVFSAITSWPFGRGFTVGAADTGSGAAGGGYMLFGSLNARSWTAGTCISGCTCVDAVYSLAADSQITIYAGTSKGVFYGVDFDTGCWHSRPPQLEMPIRDMCLARINSTGMPPDVYAATDSGVYLKSIQTTASGAWNRLLTLKTFAVEVIETSGDPVIYAGTADGLWKYDKSTPVTAKRNGVLPQPAAGKITLYSLDGRVVPRNDGRVHRGVQVMVENTGRHGESRMRCIVR